MESYSFQCELSFGTDDKSVDGARQARTIFHHKFHIPS